MTRRAGSGGEVHRSSAGELGFAFFEEGGDAFDVVFGFAGCCLEVGFVFQLVG